MKAVILAGGLGTRISEETALKPKPMIDIGGMPILWHIMKIYSSYGINDFVICCGYKGFVIKEYFANYYIHKTDVTFDMVSNKMSVHEGNSEPWKVTLIDTGEDTMTGGRIKRIREYVKDEKCFCLTYGDGVADINIKKLIDFHNKQKTLATVTATYPPGRFGSLAIENDKVTSFMEKPRGDGAMVNGGFLSKVKVARTDSLNPRPKARRATRARMAGSNLPAKLSRNAAQAHSVQPASTQVECV